MYTCKLIKGAKDIHGKDLSEFVGIEFDCQCYQSMVVVRNHITKIPLEVPIKYVEIKMPNSY